MLALDPLKQGSAHLLLQLYDQRREPTLRAARDWFTLEFHPESANDVLKTWMGPASTPYRMVTTYWEMAASFVTQGAIDPTLFYAAHSEYLSVYAKLEPFLAEVRTRVGQASYLEHLERVVVEMPDSAARLDGMRRYLAAKRQQGSGAPASGG